ELGSQDYNSFGRLNGKPSGAMAVYLLPGANQLKASEAIYKTMATAKNLFPPGLDYKIVYDTTPAVEASIHEIVKTFVEALILVTLVVFIFLQNVRATIIPLLTVPVSIVGTFIFFPLLGFSVNTLSMFGVVLAIGIVVDDAIVVVEAVMHHIEHGLSPRDATRQAMKEVSAPVIGIALILSAVFVPVAFLGGLTGQMYQQFALTIAISVLLSAFSALSLSPALAAMLLKVEEILAKVEAVDSYQTIGGYGAVTSTYQPNFGSIFVRLKPWEERHEEALHVKGIMARVNRELVQIPEAVAFPFNIPTISGFGAAAGFNFLLQDRSGSLTVDQLGAQTRAFLAAARQRPEFASLFTITTVQGTELTTRFNLLRSVEINGAPARGVSSGQALAALEEVFQKTMPKEMGFAYSSLSYQEKIAPPSAPTFILAIVFVFLLLAAMYESWRLPWAVLLGSPLVALGAFFGVWLSGYDNNVYVQIGLIMLVGLAAKNAILIVEFAKAKHEEGQSVEAAALESARLRFRPILMTAFAFILGVVPLMLASGAGAGENEVMGTAGFWGMLIATGLGVF